MPQTGGAKTAIVLAGGGSLGAVQVGMLKALARQRIVPDFVVGASVGAINGAYFAVEPNEEGVTRLERVWSRLHRADIFPFSPLNSLLAIVGRRDHLVTPALLRSLVESELQCQRLEDARIPCYVVATDVLDGREVAIAAGPIATALLASAAIPAVFPPVPLDGRHLMDGAVTNNTPISTALKLGATRVIVLPTGMSCALERPPRGVPRVARAESSGDAPVAERHRALVRPGGADRRSAPVPGQHQRVRLLANRRSDPPSRSSHAPVAEEEWSARRRNAGAVATA